MGTVEVKCGKCNTFNILSIDKLGGIDKVNKKVLNENN